MALSNSERTAWIVSQAIGDEKPTGRQIGAILEGSESLVYLEVTGKGLARPFRVHFQPSAFPHWIVFDKFDETISRFLPTLIHWTVALYYLRETNCAHNVSRILWNDNARDGKTWAKWLYCPYTDQYRISGGAYGDNPTLEELPTIPEVL